MAGADTRHPRIASFLRWVLHVLYGHRFQPVDPVLVFDAHANGAAQGTAVPYPRHDPRPVLLNEHAPAPSVAFLATSQVNGDVILTEKQARRHPLYYDRQAGPVGFTGSEKPNHAFISWGLEGIFGLR